MTGPGVLQGKVAIVGASGFVGSRLVECLHLSGTEVVPITRTVVGMARASRFALDSRVADATSAQELGEALRGCQSMVHLVAGQFRDIELAANALVPAAALAGIQRVVYLSTASVHGQNPPQGISEDSPLHDRHDFPYNNAKVRAEWAVHQNAARAGLEVITLRPGIVFGPRDRWVTEFRESLLMGKAWRYRSGAGICNTIYVDNLVEAIGCALKASREACGQPYWVGDQETVTWVDFQRSLCQELGLDENQVQVLDQLPLPARKGRWLRIQSLRAHPLGQAVIRRVPSRLKRISKAILSSWHTPSSVNPWRLPSRETALNPSLELAQLFQCRWKLPHDKAARLLGYQPRVPFQVGVQRTCEWLRWLEADAPASRRAEVPSA